MEPETRPAESETPKARRWVFLLGGLAVLAGLYGVGWQIASTRLTDNLLSAMAGMDASGRQTDCRAPQKGGFPFAVTLTCETLKSDDVEHGISSTLGQTTASLSIFAPNRIETTSKGPLEIRSTYGLLLSEWQAITSKIDLGLDGITALRADSNGLKATFTAPAKERSLQINTTNLSVFAEGRDGNLVAGLSSDGTTLARNGASLPIPALALNGEVRIDDRADLIGRFDRQALFGTSGTLESLTADLGEGRSLAISGPFSIDANGLVSGQMQLQARNVSAWVVAAQAALPEFADVIETAGGLLRSMAKGKPDLTLDLTLKRGKILVAGFIPVGELPPL
ncbi:MAG: DUF2125 domain-containing protein [Proteobacteria bacterium]|nr:DUF2125 domain-containing protein [Pseudomonadota bacterium]